MAFAQKTRSAAATMRPSYEAIYTNVHTVAELGIGNGQLRTAPLNDLLCAARIIRYGHADASGQESDEIDDLDMIEYILGNTIGSMSETNRKSGLALFGLTVDTRNASLGRRRASAIEDGELAITLESFRTHRETRLLIEVARILCQLADERIMSDWEVRLDLRESKLKVQAKSNGDRHARYTTPVETATEFDDLFGNDVITKSPSAPTKVVETTSPTVVRQAEPEKPATIAEALHLIGGVISNIFQLIMGQFDPGQYRRYVARDPWWKGTYRRKPPPRPVRTPLEYAVATSLLAVALGSICAFLLGTIMIMQFISRLIFG